MRRLLVILSSILIFSGITFASPPESYEYWLDNNYASKSTGTLIGGTWSQDISLEGLDTGLHWFSFRMADASGEYGGVYRKHFFLHSTGMNVKSWQYWFDSDPATMVTGDVSSKTMAMNIDIENLLPGMHTFNYRMCSGDGEWGGTYRKVFFSVDNRAGASSYEYWFNNNYAAKVSGDLSAGQNHYELTLSDLAPGLHSFRYRLKNGYGDWGSIYSSVFFTGNAAWSDYEYWLDNDYANKVAGKLTTNSMQFEVPLTGIKKGGAHFFNMRGRNHECLIYTSQSPLD